MMLLKSMFLLCIVQSKLSNAQYSGDCVTKCNDLRYETLSLDMCREAKKTLPRPKIGDTCSIAMEQGFSDACISLCMGEQPVSRLAQSCRKAASEMPKPTVRRWCEHGYNVAFSKTTKDLTQHFIKKEISSKETNNVINEIPIETPKEEYEIMQNEVKENQEVQVEDAIPPELEQSIFVGEKTDRTRKVQANIPVTLDGKDFELTIYEDSSIDQEVEIFCTEKVPDDISGCVQDLLPTVLSKMVLT